MMPDMPQILTTIINVARRPRKRFQIRPQMDCDHGKVNAMSDVSFPFNALRHRAQPLDSFDRIIRLPILRDDARGQSVADPLWIMCPPGMVRTANSALGGARAC
jgi:hypothetical protein